MISRFPAVTILTSGVGLGVYIPALLIERQLAGLGWSADVEVLEGYYRPDRQQGHLAYKKAVHEDFKLAQLSHRMVRDVQDSLDPQRLERLLQRWLAEGRVNFIVWSGFWLPIIDRYRKLLGGPALHVDHCRIDAEISASFKIHPHLDSNADSIWLWNWEQRKIGHEVPVTAEAPVLFKDRAQRLVVHGGGWGIGTYGSKADEIAHTKYGLDVVVHAMNEIRSDRNGDRFFMVDPGWHPWLRNTEGHHEFPPMAQITPSTPARYQTNRNCHELYNVIRHAKAIVSKPGGCTLIDSLASATPVVLLEPYGYAEKSNARIWEHLGYGISFDAWKRSGFDEAVLETVHSNILARPKAPGYPLAYVERFARSATA